MCGGIRACLKSLSQLPSRLFASQVLLQALPSSRREEDGCDHAETLLAEPTGRFFLLPVHTLLSQLLEVDKFSVSQPRARATRCTNRGPISAGITVTSPHLALPEELAVQSSVISDVTITRGELAFAFEEGGG